jgi:hypothetical protein
MSNSHLSVWRHRRRARIACFVLQAQRGSYIQRHVYVNDPIYKALIRATVPAVNEPQGLVRVDGKRPDGLTLVPWRSGRCATWDVTVIDTLAASYVLQSAVNAASAAKIAASRKEVKHSTLNHSYEFFSCGC